VGKPCRLLLGRDRRGRETEEQTEQ
jgi:hypothetical protein